MGLNHRDKDPANTARQYRRIDRIIKIDHDILALRTERQRLVRENEEDECNRPRPAVKVVQLREWRNRQRFRIDVKHYEQAA